MTIEHEANVETSVQENTSQDIQVEKEVHVEGVSQESAAPEVVAEVKQEEVAKADVQETAVNEAVQASESHAEGNDFLSLLNEDLRGSQALQDFKDVNSLAKSYLELNKFLGKRLEDMSPEELETYYDKLGRPKSADEYEVNLEGELTDWYKQTAHELGLSKRQAEKLAESYHKIEEERMQQYETQKQALMDDWVNQVKQEFGPEFDNRVKIAQAAVRTFGGEELKNFLNETGLGNHPAMVKAFAEIGKELGEDKLVNPESTGGFGITPKEAQQKISMLKSDPDFMDRYLARGKYRKSSKEHQEAVKQIQDLYSLAFPG